MCKLSRHFEKTRTWGHGKNNPIFPQEEKESDIYVTLAILKAFFSIPTFKILWIRQMLFLIVPSSAWMPGNRGWGGHMMHNQTPTLHFPFFLQPKAMTLCHRTSQSLFEPLALARHTLPTGDSHSLYSILQVHVYGLQVPCASIFLFFWPDHSLIR